MIRLVALLSLSSLAFLAVAQDGWELELARPAPLDDDVSGPLLHWEQHECSACHATIAAEWAESLHAHAWVDPRYEKGLEGKRRPQSCYGCHAPEPLHLAEEFGRKPGPREDEESRHFGIDCKSCHLGPDDTILGPFGQATEAHASARSEHFVGTGSNALCISCHRTNIGPVIGIARDFEEADLGARGMSCVGCHMAPVERAVATAGPDGSGAPTPARAGRSHLLQTPRDPGFLAQAFALGARQAADAIVIRIENRAGHRVPGLMGREIRFSASLPGAPEADTGTVHELWIDERAYLPLAGSVELRVAGAADTVLVRGTHRGPHAEEVQAFLELELPVE